MSAALVHSDTRIGPGEPDGIGTSMGLTAWVPPELNGSDMFYLGGLTPVRILDVPG